MPASTVVKMGLANTVRNKLLLSLTLSPTLPVMVMLGAIIFNQLSQKSMQCRKFRKISQPHCCCDSLSSSCSGCLEMMGICTIIKARKQQGQQAENSIQRAVVPGVIILSASGLSEIYGFPLYTAAPLLWWLPHRHCPSPDRVEGIRGELGCVPPTSHLSPASSTSGTIGTV